MQFLEAGFGVGPARHLDAGQARGAALGHVAGDLHLTHQRIHVRRQARFDEYIGLDASCLGIGFGLLEDVGQIVEHARQYRDGRLVHGQGHGGRSVIGWVEEDQV
ncbi:hypothetical protein FQZ97_1201000 [compost metagenome]